MDSSSSVASPQGQSLEQANACSYSEGSQDMSEALSTQNAPVYIATSITEITDCTLINTETITEILLIHQEKNGNLLLLYLRFLQMLFDDILTIFNHILAMTHFFVCSGLLECQLSGKRSTFLMDHQWLEMILEDSSHCLSEGPPSLLPVLQERTSVLQRFNNQPHIVQDGLIRYLQALMTRGTEMPEARGWGNSSVQGH